MLALAAVVPLVVLSAAPWEGEAFEGDPREIARAASRLDPSGAFEIDVLLEEVRISFDEKGCHTTTHRIVYLPRSAVAATQWSTVEAEYSPWREERPVIRARVIAPSGDVRLLDPQTLLDAPVQETPGPVFADRRVVRGPLPGIAAGAVVEEVTLRREKVTSLQQGSVVRVYAERGVPVRRYRVRVDAPTSVPLRHARRGFGEPRELVETDRRVLVWDEAPLAEAPPRESFAVPEESALRYLSFSTVTSWAKAAADYAAIVDRQLAGSDLSEAARTIIARGDPPDRASDKVLAWIATRARYTGLLLGDAEIVPARPVDTLARGYGDCKDLSLVAVALLRAAGYEASLALLRAGEDEIDPDLPGLGLFDHAVVRVGAKTPVWLDPSDPALAAGELSEEASGRLALVASRSATKLVRTPRTTAGDSEARKTRIVTMGEGPFANVTEVTEARGLSAAFVERAATVLEGSAGERFARERLAAEAGPASFRVERRHGHAEPSRYSLAAARSTIGSTGEDEAWAVVTPQPAFWGLPDLFPIAPPTSEERKPLAGRRTRVRVAPYRTELQYRVIPPPGFRARPLATPDRWTIGPVTFAAQQAIAPNGAVTVTYRFEVGGAAMSPKDAEALWRAVAERSSRDRPRVTFERVAEALLAAGDGRGAIAEVRRLADGAPESARHQRHLARTLLAVGLGDAARGAARRGVELAPDSRETQRVLAYVLEHDGLGRRFRPGCDVAGAAAAWRRVRELEPRDPGVRAALAFVLQHGERGEWFGPGARTEEALEELRFARDELGARDFDADLTVALLHARRPAEALAIARETKPGLPHDALVLAALALGEGAESASREAARLAPDTRQAVIGAAARELTNARAYSAAGALLSRSERGAASQSFAAVLQRVRPLDATDGSADLWRRFLGALVAPDPGAALSALYARGNVPERDVTIARGLVAGLRAGVRSRGVELGTVPLVELLSTDAERTAEGEDACRIERIRFGTAGASEFTLLVVEVDGKRGLAALQPRAVELGTEAFRAVQNGDVACAKRLLRWARTQEGFDPTGDMLDGALAKEPPDGAEIAITAAALASAGPAAPEALPILQRARAGSKGAARFALSTFLLQAASVARDERVLAFADEISREFPIRADVVAPIRIQALWRARRTDALRLLATELRRDANPSGRTLRTLAFTHEALGDFTSAADVWRKVAALKEGSAEDLNRAAWAELFVSSPRRDAEALAREGVAREKGDRYAALHTLAATLAALDQPSEAMQVLQTALDDEERAPDASEWLVAGRIAAAYGLPGEAATLYRRAVTSSDDSPSAPSQLARRWLDALSPPATGGARSTAR